MSYEDPFDRRVREVKEAQQRREEAKQRVIDDARRRAEDSGATAFGYALARYADAVVHIEGFEPQPVDQATLAANQVSWAQVREAGPKIIEANRNRR
jgi:hypothetical protein